VNLPIDAALRRHLKAFRETLSNAGAADGLAVQG